MKSSKGNSISYNLKEIPIDRISVWDEAQARSLDTDGIDELAKSIAQEGLQSPPIVQKNGNSYLLMVGQRRLEALKRLGAKTAPVFVLRQEDSLDLPDAKAISIIENLHRKNMGVKEMTSSCQFLAEKIGKAKAAKILGINSSTLREYLGFGAVPENIKEMVPKTISKRDAIRICKVLPAESDAVGAINKIKKYDGSQKKRYLDALERLGNVPHSEILKLANSFRARQNISLKISKIHAKGLAKLSRESEMEPAELAQKIVSDYLVRKGFRQ